MHPEILKIAVLPAETTRIFLTDDPGNLPGAFFTKEEIKFIARQKKELKKELVHLNRLDHWTVVCFIKDEKDESKRLEYCRKSGDRAASFLNDQKIRVAVVYDVNGLRDETLAFTEGMALGSYQFLKYKKEKDKGNALERILVYSKVTGKEDIQKISVIVEAVARCRTLINEPYSYLTAAVFASEIRKMGQEAGFRVEVMNRKKIESLKMGGILAVNQASDEPPTFTIAEWNPANAVNKKPLILVGKGVVYDTGGANLKPGDSMLTMKDDMSGAAAVASTLYAVARLGLKVHVIGLIPATDNKIGPKGVLPGDVIRMFNGMTVEVINTDAEGRLILADALSYAKKYDPMLVVDIATLTGSAVRAIGKWGIVSMQSKAGNELGILMQSGFRTYERIVEFPNWDEYGELMNSELADLKNLGPAEAGAITAAKFLEKFTDYPYIHLDIAGPAYLEKRDSYRGQGGTGTGVRLFIDFIHRLILQKHKK